MGLERRDLALQVDVTKTFVRCRGRVSHYPDQHVELADAGTRVLRRLIENFRPRDRA